MQGLRVAENRLKAAAFAMIEPGRHSGRNRGKCQNVMQGPLHRGLLPSDTGLSGKSLSSVKESRFPDLSRLRERAVRSESRMDVVRV